MRILVTGGLGFIGSHTVLALLEKGHEVVIVDDLSNSEASVLDGIARISGQRPVWHCLDINDSDALEGILGSERIQGVIHFAAFKAVGESVQDPIKYFSNNVGGMLSLMRAMQNVSIDAVVFSSSCTVYGDTDSSPITEEHPRQKAASPYGTTKIICEDILEDLCTHASMNGMSLRYFNPVGAHPSGHIGELPIGRPNNLVPFITQTAAGIHQKLTIFGKDYPTPDGTNIRDYIHVMDLAEAHVLAIEHIQKHPGFSVYNLGTGKGNSVLEVLQCFNKVNGLEVAFEFGPRRAGDVVAIWADPSKAERELGWKAKLSLEEMMRDAWNWQRSLQS